MRDRHDARDIVMDMDGVRRRNKGVRDGLESNRRKELQARMIHLPLDVGASGDGATNGSHVLEIEVDFHTGQAVDEMLCTVTAGVDVHGVLVTLLEVGQASNGKDLAHSKHHILTSSAAGVVIFVLAIGGAVAFTAYASDDITLRPIQLVNGV